MLSIRGLDAFYGRAQALFGVDMEVAAGEAVALMGRNGAGKSTTLKCVMGLIAPAAGAIRFEGEGIAGREPFRIARLGLGYVPEDRRIFTGLTIEENLELARRPPVPGRPEWTPERLFGLFPNLAELRGRRGAHISGGEQQMLTLARTLMGNPSMLLLDEPSEGLAPRILEQIAETVGRVKSEGLTLLLSEQNLGFAGAVADRVAILETGHLRWTGAMADFLADTDAQHRYLAA